MTGGTRIHDRPDQQAPELRTAGPDIPLILVLSMWVMRIMEPEWFIYTYAGGPLFWLPTLLAPIILLLSIRRFSSRQLYWPLIVLAILHVIASVVSENAGLARGPTKFLLHTQILFMASVAMIRTPSQVVTLFKIFLLGFLWYGVQGVAYGLVPWHPLLANEDSFGPLMAMGFGFAYFFSRGSRSRRWRLIGMAMSILGVVGVISSIARGAVLSAAATALVVWLRSPHRIRTTLVGIAAILVAFLAASILFPDGRFWTEMATISGGSETGTGQGRLVIWSLAMGAYADHPIIGVGAGNCGVWISENIALDPNRVQYGDPRTLYMTAMHNVYVTVVCEQGTLGAIAFVVMLFDFVRRVRFFRSKPALRAWTSGGDPELDLRYLSLGLEAGMVAYLSSAFFYNQLYIHWFWTLVIMTAVLDNVVRQRLAPTHVSPEHAIASHNTQASRRDGPGQLH